MRSQRVTADGAAIVLFVAIAGAVLALRFFDFSWRALTFPYPLDYGEGAILDAALRLSRFDQIYRPDLTSPPWFVANYPPVFYLIQVPFVWLAGPQLWYGRLVSQLSMLATAVLIARVLYDVTYDRAAALVAGLTFVTIPVVAVWAQYDRVDSVALMLSWLGVWSVVRRRTRPGLALAVVCFVASSFTRQTAAIPGLVAAYAWLRWEGSRADANALVLRVCAVGGAVLLTLTIVTRGGFVTHVVTGTVGRMIPEQLASLTRELVSLIPVLLVATACVAVLGVWRRLPGWSLVAAYAIGAAAISLTVAKEGSYINYFLDLCAACSLAAGAGLAWLSSYKRLAAAVFVLILTVQTALMARPNPLSEHLSARLKRSTEYGRLADVVRGNPGPIIADEPMALLPLAGRTIDFQPFAMTQLARAGRWDESPFTERLRERRYALILLRMSARRPVILGNLWDAPMADAILQNYTRTDEIPVDDSAFIGVYRPR